jgi:hypothetical protein
MRAYLKIALILALAVLIDCAAFAPHRRSEAIMREAREDWPRCSAEIDARMRELKELDGNNNDPSHTLACWNRANEEHLKHCHRSHLADEINRERDWPDSDKPLYARVVDKLRLGVHCVIG